jgi:hypothetical protein
MTQNDEELEGSSFAPDKQVEGRWFVPTVIISLSVFTLIATLLTYFGGKWLGGFYNQKALAHERDIQAQKMRTQEAKRETR